MRIGIIGCGYVADYYAANARRHPDCRIIGAADISEARSRAFESTFGVKAYDSPEALLAEDSIELVLNLTNPRVHDAVTLACIDAGRHVYSEKPLGMTVDRARSLAEHAARRGVRIGCAPCSVLGATARTVRRALDEGAVGRARLVYANYDDGILGMGVEPASWRSPSGAPWPATDEFEVGCTLEHAGYVITWLVAFFGPVRSVTSFATCLTPDKGVPVSVRTPDFTVGCLEFDHGVVARLTCGLLAPRDKSMLIVGDDGRLLVNELRDDRAPVLHRRDPARGAVTPAERAVERLGTVFKPLAGRLGMSWPWRMHRPYPRAVPDPPPPARGEKSADFMLGVAEMVHAIGENRPHALSAELGIHVLEVALALQHPDLVSHKRMETSVSGLDSAIRR